MSELKNNRGPNILVVGTGGIGGLVTGYLSEVGLDVTAMTRNAEIASAIQSDGIEIQGDGNPRKVKASVRIGPPTEGTYDYILLATQPPQVEEAARSLVDRLAPRGRMVVFQNGLCEERIAKICGADRVIGGIIAWGASMVRPGVYDRTSAGGFQLGTLSGIQDKKLRELAAILEAVGPVTLTKNLRGARWSKLALNSCISSLGTMAGERLGPLVRVRNYRRLGLEIFAEVIDVARAEGVHLEKVAGTLDLHWLNLSQREREGQASPNLAAKHAMLLAVGLRYRRLRSSMLSAIERGRPPSIDFLNGEVCERAKIHGIETPVNTRVVQIIHDIAAKKTRSSRARLDELYRDTRTQS